MKSAYKRGYRHTRFLFRWESERIKSEKRQKREAQKTALRAEDIAKGVFTPVGNLPKVEPQKFVSATMTSTTKNQEKMCHTYL
jgi:hypothetical protein